MSLARSKVKTPRASLRIPRTPWPDYGCPRAHRWEEQQWGDVASRLRVVRESACECEECVCVQEKRECVGVGGEHNSFDVQRGPVRGAWYSVLRRNTRALPLGGVCVCIYMCIYSLNALCNSLLHAVNSLIHSQPPLAPRLPCRQVCMRWSARRMRRHTRTQPRTHPRTHAPTQAGLPSVDVPWQSAHVSLPVPEEQKVVQSLTASSHCVSTAAQRRPP